MIGRTVSHYRITRELGAGGMGVVYEAVDTKLDRTVALKFLPPESTRDPDAKARFIHEAKAASAIDHPNVCNIFEIDETDDGHLFLAMACYEGETLKERIARGPLPIDEALDITRQIAEGLQEAHARDIVHRDIKPANIFITDGGLVKILDFGLAKLAGLTQLTKTGTTLGTGHYMSPEQAAGRETDRRTDLWSLGVVLFEMVTGRVPFGGDHLQAVMYAIQSTEPEPVTGLRTGVPLGLERIIGKCLAKDAAERYQHAEDLLADLLRLKRESEASRTATLAPQTMKAPRRWPWMLGFLGLGAVLAVSAWTLWGSRGTSVPPAEQALAVIDFTDPADEEGLIRATGLHNLVHSGLVDSDLIRVVSPSLLQDIQRREFGGDGSRIEQHQALAVARLAHASHLLSGHITELGGDLVFVWEMVETKTGHSIGAGRVPCDELLDSAGLIVEDVLPGLAAATGTELPLDRRDSTEFSTSSTEAYRYFTMGLIARQEGRHEGLQFLEKAVAIDSLFALAHFEIARSTSGSGDLIEEDSVKSQWHGNRAWELRERLGARDQLRLEIWRDSFGLGDKADGHDWRTAYRRSLALWPDDLELLTDFASRLFFLHYFTECAAISQQGLTYYPDDETLFTYMIASSRIAGLHAGADSLFEVAEERFASRPVVWDDIGYFQLALGNPDRARAAFVRALPLESDRSLLDSRLAEVLFAEGDPSGAADQMILAAKGADLSHFLRLRMIYAHLGVSDVLAEAGRFEEGVRILDDAAASVPPENTQQKKRLGWARLRLLWRQGRYENILAMMDSCARSTPDIVSLNHQFFACRSHIALGRPEAAVALIDSFWWWDGKGVRKGRTMARQATGELEIARGRPVAALDTLDLNIPHGSLGWDDWAIDWRRARAFAHRANGDLETAREEWLSLLRVFGGHALAHFELGRLNEEMNRPDDAIRSYEKFLEMWSEADVGLPQLMEARQRLMALNESTN